MTIQPLSNPQRDISVTEAIEPAYERVKMMLFRPFNLSKWIVIGFCAWLAGLGESGGAGGGNFGNFGNNGFGNHGNTQPAEEFRHMYHAASDYVTMNLVWIVPVAAFFVLFCLAIGLGILWLNCRGKFMFLHCVALDKAEVEVPWTKYATAGNSLFWFRVVLGLAGMLLVLPVMIFMAVDIVRMVLAGEPDYAGVLLAVGLGLLLIPLSIVFALIRKFTADFVVPVMYLRGCTCTAAWKEVWGLLAGNPGKFTLYILFQIVLGMAIGALVVAAFIATCCIACCLSLLPFVGTVVLLPVLIFKRAYPLYYLAQYGPQYDVFPAPAAPAPAPVAMPGGIQPMGPVS